MVSYEALVILTLALSFIHTSCHQHHHKSHYEEDFKNDYDNDFYNGHTSCDHDHIEHDPGFLDVEETDFSATGEGRNLASSSYPQLRIYPYYSILNQTAPTAYTSYIQNQLAPSAISFLQGALTVKAPISTTLKVVSVQSTLCGVATPNILLTTGVAADFFIFFDSDYDSTSSWVAQSTVCYMSTSTHRPLIVTTKFNRALLKDPAGDVLLQEKNVYLLIHEMTHVLGFSTSLYPYFLDSDGVQRTGHILTKTLDGGTSVVLNTPTLTQRLRNFFGCSSLAGAYMENTGTDATAGSHFERRQFIFDYMTSGLIYQQKISQFALALLEDSGWYVPNYDYAEPYYFGQGQGCGFLLNSCNSSGFNYDEFCTGTTRGCSSQGRGGGVCQTDVRSDGCKYYMPNVNYDCENPDAANYARLPGIQTFGRGAGSQCFEGSLASTTSSATETSFCFKYTCQATDTNTVVKVQIGKQVVTCRKAGSVTIPGYYGSFDCPDPLEFCQTTGRSYCPRNCLGRGTCVNNKCVCNKGFTGTDCGLNL